MSVAINCDRCGEYGTDVVYCNNCELKARADAIAEGRRLERAAIVADLRACAAAVGAMPRLVANYVEGLAERYESGAHEEGKLRLRAEANAAVAAAREEQREACAQWMQGPEPTMMDVANANSVRATPITATPLADEIAALRAQNDELREHLREKEAQRLSAHTESAALRARDVPDHPGGALLVAEVAALRARVAELAESLRLANENVVELAKAHAETAAERDALRAQVRAVRDECEFAIELAGRPPATTEDFKRHEAAATLAVDVLRAIDEAKP